MKAKMKIKIVDVYHYGYYGNITNTYKYIAELDKEVYPTLKEYARDRKAFIFSIVKYIIDESNNTITFHHSFDGDFNKIITMKRKKTAKRRISKKYL